MSNIESVSFILPQRRGSLQHSSKVPFYSTALFHLILLSSLLVLRKWPVTLIVWWIFGS